MNRGGEGGRAWVFPSRCSSCAREVDLVPLARACRASAAARRDEAAAPWRVAGHGVAGAAAVLVALRLADRFQPTPSPSRGGGGGSSNGAEAGGPPRQGVPVAGCVSLGAPKGLAGDAARRAAKRLRGALLHVTQVRNRRSIGWGGSWAIDSLPSKQTNK